MQDESGLCVVCLQPLTNASVDGICPLCSLTRVVDLPADTLRPLGTVPLAAIIHSTPETDEPLPPNPPDLELLRLIGRGGMGGVYLARELNTNRLVAVKFLHAPGDPAAIERFQIEVQVLAALKHPNIVTVYTINFNCQVPYFTMEYVPGATIARWVSARGPLSPRQAAALLAPIARATHAAHGQNIVHRDIKPGNILLWNADCGFRIEDKQTTGSDSSIPHSTFRIPHSNDSACCPKLSDFGLAKRLDRAETLTAGGVVGTPGFMAPEQAAGESVTPRTDVYGLGATLYYALTGRAPVEAQTPAEWTLRLLYSHPKLVRTHCPEVPLELEAIVHKCLEKDPAGRYGSAAEVAEELDRFLSGEPVLAQPLTRWRRLRRSIIQNRRRLTRLAAVAVALVAVFVLGAGLSGNPKPEPAPPPAPETPTPLDEMKKELAAGRPVALVDQATGAKWHQLVKGKAALPVRAPAPFVFESFDFAMIDLCPDPMTDRYRIRAELAQRSVVGRGPDGKLPIGGTYDLGLYFGRQSLVGNNGWRAECVFAIRFTEVPKRNPERFAALTRFVITESPTQGPVVAGAGCGSAAFVQADKLPGPWRTIEVEVTAGSIQAWWINPDGSTSSFGKLTPEQVQRAYTARHESLDKIAPGHGIVFPAWNPRSALGVWGRGSAVTVRNVTITPLK
ncbi:MAG: serine/threonine protein kinase [Planctomycetia bacterium]|nr:serine/threonine protein kinase [Planctomycetia bacterium]